MLYFDLRRWNACREARKWVGFHSLRWAWTHCHDPEWMTWYIRKIYFRRLYFPGASFLGKDLLCLSYWQWSAESLRAEFSANDVVRLRKEARRAKKK